MIFCMHFCPRSAILYHTILQGSPNQTVGKVHYPAQTLISCLWHQSDLLILMASYPKHYSGISINLCILRASLPGVHSFFPHPLSLPLWVLRDEIQFKS